MLNKEYRRVIYEERIEEDIRAGTLLRGQDIIMKNLFQRDHEEYEVNLDMVIEGYEEDQCLIKLTKNLILLPNVLPEEEIKEQQSEVLKVK